MKTKLILAALLALPMFAFADDSFNKGMKVECLLSSYGPAVQIGDEITIDESKRIVRKEKTTVMASKSGATMFTGKSMINGWAAQRTDIDAGYANYRNRGAEGMIMVINKDSEYTITVLLPDRNMLEVKNCNITWMEN